MLSSKKFKRHFRIYLVNNHPAYFVDQDDKKYIFHRVTSSTHSGGRKNYLIKPNPLYSGKSEMFIVKRREKDKKNRFSKFALDVKKGTNIEYKFIDNKKVPSAPVKNGVTSSGNNHIKPNRK